MERFLAPHSNIGGVLTQIATPGQCKASVPLLLIGLPQEESYTPFNLYFKRDVLILPLQ